MAGELHEISRLLGQLESKLENVVFNQNRNAAQTHERLDGIEKKIEPLLTVVEDHKKMKQVQDRHEELVQRGYGLVLAISGFVAAFGYVLSELAKYALKKMGWLSS